MAHDEIAQGAQAEPKEDHKNAFPSLSLEKLAQVEVTMKDPDRTELIQEYFLQSLSFPQMNDRENEVNKATVNTYSWLLKDGTEFVSWLVDTDQEIYWINGKPGCGKSTLMRFISENSITRQKLRIWSRNKPFVNASYYFWTSGTKDQRSQAGLLRSLLSQLLVQHRELMPKAMPDLWLKVWNMSTLERIKTPVIWDLDNLLDALRMLLGQIIHDTKVILFVDGLDEFDGDHTEIISIFNALVNDAKKSIKLCLSSRSWPVFEEGYKGRPQFKLQDYTYQDIALHIFRNLKTNESLASLSLEEPEWYKALVERLVQKAEGVFLWASLAVKYICKVSHWLDTDEKQTNGSLVEGRDETVASQKTDLIDAIANSLPGELDELFGWLVFDHPRSNPATIGLPATLLKAREIVTEFTSDQTKANISLWDMVTASTSPLEDHNHQSREQLPTWIDDTESEVEQVQNSDLKTWLSYYNKVLDEAAPGLLVHHIKGYPEDGLTREQREAKSKVTYAHRTVKDWLDQAEIQQKLAKAVFENAQPSKPNDYQRDWLPHMINLGICQLSRRKPIFPPRKGKNINELWPFVVLTMTHARLAQDELESLRNSSLSKHLPTLQQRYIRQLSAINTVLTWYWRKSPGKADDSWAKNSFGSYQERHSMIFNNPWLSICTRFGLRTYVLYTLTTLQNSGVHWQAKGEIPLLSHAVEFLASRKNTVYPRSDPLLVSGLLEAGFSPDEPYVHAGRNLTPWLCLLENVQQAERRGWIVAGDAERWVRICDAFVAHGASLAARTVGWAKDPAVGARELLSRVREKYGFVGLVGDETLK